ncbi:MAG: nodulation protein NfeD [Chloroflexi bacterium]|nr:nodulation protein NfeD [Chloroflexota bacterium]
MRPKSRLRALITLFIFTGLMLAGLIGPVVAQVRAQAPHALLLKVDGIINPVKERLIARTIRQAQEDGATLVIIELDTPGGLLSSTRKIVTDLLESPVPVAVYVSPRGARAGSAGTFITAAANFAVMAPGTNIGAATPIAAGGQDLEETLATKVENDAAALIRSIAQERGRNEDKLEETVRLASSFSAQEAVELNVVDFIAENLDDLLAQLDGKMADTASGPRVLDTRDLDLRRVNKNLLENFLELISDPNISFILLTIGGLGIVIELFNPGLIAPGVVGVICLLLAFLALGNLPVNWAGVIFILVAVALVVLEATVAGFGILGVGAAVCFIIGGLILFGGTSPTLPSIGVNRWLLGGFTAVFAFTAVYVGRTVYQSRRAGREPSRPAIVGATGTVTGELAPTGVVQVQNETWTAVSEDGNVIHVGEAVRVIAVDGLILTVSRA